MKIHRHPTFIQKGAVLIGNYDGVHIGHQQLIFDAKIRSSHVTLITFDPNPKDYFGQPFTYIQTMYDKLLTLKAFGVDQVIILPFNHELSQLSSDQFEKDIIAPLQPEVLVVGEDFRYGRKRVGNITSLQKKFNVHVPKDVMHDNTKVSSTFCRKQLEDGNVQLTNQLFARPFHISGRVRHGQHLGRTLGYPTANLHAPHYPLSGIYAGHTILPDQSCHLTAISIGYRPMAPVPHGMLEAHLLDYDGDLYGQRIHVLFFKKIRDQIKLESFDALKIQMDKDVENIRDFFKKPTIYSN